MTLDYGKSVPLAGRNMIAQRFSAGWVLLWSRNQWTTEFISILIRAGTGTPSFVAGLNFHFLIASSAFASACLLDDDLIILGSCTKPSMPTVTVNTVVLVPCSEVGAGSGVSIGFGGVPFDLGFVVLS